MATVTTTVFQLPRGSCLVRGNWWVVLAHCGMVPMADELERRWWLSLRCCCCCCCLSGWFRRRTGNCLTDISPLPQPWRRRLRQLNHDGGGWPIVAGRQWLLPAWLRRRQRDRQTWQGRRSATSNTGYRRRRRIAPAQPRAIPLVSYTGRTSYCVLRIRRPRETDGYRAELVNMCSQVDYQTGRDAVEDELTVSSNVVDPVELCGWETRQVVPDGSVAPATRLESLSTCFRRHRGLSAHRDGAVGGSATLTVQCHVVEGLSVTVAGSRQTVTLPVSRRGIAVGWSWHRGLVEQPCFRRQLLRRRRLVAESAACFAVDAAQRVMLVRSSELHQLPTQRYSVRY